MPVISLTFLFFKLDTIREIHTPSTMLPVSCFSETDKTSEENHTENELKKKLCQRKTTEKIGNHEEMVVSDNTCQQINKGCSVGGKKCYFFFAPL